MDDLLKQMPPMFSGDGLTEALRTLPSYDADIKNADVASRLLALEDIYQIYIPSDLSREIYAKLYISIIRGLKSKGSSDATRLQNKNYMQVKQEYKGIVSGADSFTILGASGIGKSTAIARAISLATNNRLIQTESTTIIPCIQIQCPFDCSVKSMLFNILDTIDRVLDTNYYEKAVRARATTDILISSVSNILLNRVCVLIIDEIQNVLNHKSGSSLVGVLVQLINNSGITVCMVGIPESEVFFQKTDYLARRAMGLKFERMEYTKEFIDFCKVIYNYQYTKDAESFTESHCLWLFEHTGGVVALVVALIHDAQEIAILEGSDTLSIAALDAAYKKRYSMVKGCKQVKLSSAGTKKQNSSAIPSAEKNMDSIVECTTYSSVIKTAKAKQIEMATALKTQFCVLEVPV